MEIRFEDLATPCEACKGTGKNLESQTGFAPGGVGGMGQMMTIGPCETCGGGRYVLTPSGKALKQFVDMLRNNSYLK